MSGRNPLNTSTPNDRDVVFTRDFDAPRELVWDALTKPDMLRTWLSGPPGWEMTSCADDQRVGGKYRWEWKGPGEAAMSMDGVYQELAPPERMTRTEAMELGGARQPGEQLAKLELADLGNRTRLTLTLTYAMPLARDGALSNGMDQGMAASYDRLDEMLASRLSAHG